MMRPLEWWFVRLAWAASALAFAVIVFGAFVRLSHAGLSCPDWPTCYGAITWPGHADQVAAANLAFPERPVEAHKTWREQGHRFAAATLGLVVLVLAWLGARGQGRRSWLVGLSALAATAGVFTYIAGNWPLSLFASLVAMAAPVFLALDPGRSTAQRLALLTLPVIIFQAMLGMWTVTWLLKPAVVMAHLMGGLLTFSLLVALAWALGSYRPRRSVSAQGLMRWLVLGLVLLGGQVALGGWTSANYAALACGLDFPQCMGQWWPATDFREGFVLWRGIGVNYEGGILDAPARTAIHLAHRIGALVVLAALGLAAAALWRRGWRNHALALVIVLLTQVAIGIGNVLTGLPLWLATAHNGVAALLLFVLLSTIMHVRTAGHVSAGTGCRPSRT